MKITTAFPSDYLRAADLGGRMATVTMDRVEVREFAGEPKPVLYFEGKQRGLVLNKTNSGVIADAYGEETDDWAGKPLVLYEAVVDFQGRRVQAIRVRVSAPLKQAVNGDRAAPTSRLEASPSGLDDEIPF